MGRIKFVILLGILSLVFLSNIFRAEPPVNYASGLNLSGTQTLTLSQNQTIIGGINLSGQAVLTIKNAVVIVQHPQNNPRETIDLHNSAKLILQNASLVPGLLSPENLYLTAYDNSQVIINNGTIYNVLNLVGNAKITGNRARVYSSAYPFYIPETGGAFGIVQLAQNTQANFSNSTVGSFALFFSPNDQASFSNLGPKTYKDFNLKRDAFRFSPSYNIILKNTTVMPVVLHGPFERGWAIFVDPASNVTVSNSSLNKLVFQQFQNQNLTFRDLKFNMPQNFTFSKVRLINTSVANEWGFFGLNCNITVINSSEVWLWPMGVGTWRMFNSKMIEFDPRAFNGSLILNNSEWSTAGEVYQGSNIQIFGTVITSDNQNRRWTLADSTITRHYPVQNSTQQVVIRFTLANYYNNFTEVITPNGKPQNITISFFSNTPLSAPASTTSTVPITIPTTLQATAPSIITTAVSTTAVTQSNQTSTGGSTDIISGIIKAIANFFSNIFKLL